MELLLGGDSQLRAAGLLLICRQILPQVSCLLPVELIHIQNSSDKLYMPRPKVRGAAQAEPKLSSCFAVAELVQRGLGLKALFCESGSYGYVSNRSLADI